MMKRKVVEANPGCNGVVLGGQGLFTGVTHSASAICIRSSINWVSLFWSVLKSGAE
jgi:hypothetical protein